VATVANTFAVGDVVRLVSGGPEMAVKFVPSTHRSTYTCQWFAGKKLEQGEFPADSLEKVPPKQA
jgi:uncharacterized protein YodC (DUF2158 family)